MIYIIKHRECETPKMDGYKDLYVGDMCDYLDKDNINQYNPYINELTGLYYMWKHCDDEYIGLAHYRRFLLDENGDILTFDKAKELLNEYDFLFCERYIVGNGIYPNLRSEIGNEINQKTLDKYVDELCEIEPELREFFKNTYLYPRNMFVCRKELMDRYCEWLFPIIIPLTEQFIKEDKEINQKDRLFGYLFERLFTYYLLKNNFKIKELKCNETMDRLMATEAK